MDWNHPNLPTSSPPTQASLDLSSLPPIFLFPTHLDTDDLHEVEEKITDAGGLLTYDIAEAKIILSRAERKKRVEMDLRGKGLYTEQIASLTRSKALSEDFETDSRPAKRRKISRSEEAGQDRAKAIVIDDESTASEDETDATAEREAVKRESSQNDEAGPVQALSTIDRIRQQLSGDTIKLLKLQWFEDCVKAGELLPIESYLTYEGRIVGKAQLKKSVVSASQPSTQSKSFAAVLPHKPLPPKNILERAQADPPAQQKGPHGYRSAGQRRFGHGDGSSTTTFGHGSGSKSQHTHLLQQTTSEYEGDLSSELPEMPDWVKQGVKYACQRITLANPPNNEFIELLKKIKLARLLTNDEIGVRAYSTSIAALAAYPHRLSNPREILVLPGCDVKIANLYVEYANTGAVKAASDAESNEELQTLRLFYNIWGVGALTAREFYYDRGWRELDDIVEFGWSTLSRVQQIGVKYYTEFLSPIPRAEVEEIAVIIKKHAVKVRDKGVQTCIVGGYRRGKQLCGDVDIIVSHPDERQTLHIINDIVASLETEGWITHTLLLSLTSSQRGQQTLPFRTGASGGHGFDTLDKALVVWQNPEWAGKTADLAADPKARNPNVHRRVDIIVSPWRTVGCAVAGWTSGTTFQRDLRRYAKNVKEWKFDSSGVRDRTTGKVVDLEGWEAEEGMRAKTMEEAERRVFDGFGLEWREPWERCTG